MTGSTKLYGVPLSSATRRAALILEEKQVPFEFVHVDTANGEHKSAEYLQKQPFGQIPYLEDGDVHIYESRAIGRYIAEKYADQGTPGLIPSELKARAVFEQAASSEFANFDFLASQAVRTVVGARREGREPDWDKYNELYKQLSAKLDAYEVILSKQKYLAGENVTLADLFHIPFGVMLANITSDVFEKRPNISRWWNDITSRPSWNSIKEGAHSTV